MPFCNFGCIHTNLCFIQSFGLLIIASSPTPPPTHSQVVRGSGILSDSSCHSCHLGWGLLQEECHSYTKSLGTGSQELWGKFVLTVQTYVINNYVFCKLIQALRSESNLPHVTSKVAQITRPSFSYTHMRGSGHNGIPFTAFSLGMRPVHAIFCEHAELPVSEGDAQCYWYYISKALLTAVPCTVRFGTICSTIKCHVQACGYMLSHILFQVMGFVVTLEFTSHLNWNIISPKESAETGRKIRKGICRDGIPKVNKKGKRI